MENLWNYGDPTFDDEEFQEENDELAYAVRNLLRFKCIFLLDKEVETLKNRQILREVNNYMKYASNINIRKIILRIVKSFTEKYFSEVKEHLKTVLRKVPSALGGGNVKQGSNILNNCLVILEKRMFENLFEELNQEPLMFLMIFNKFELDFIKTEERYKLEFSDDHFNCSIENGLSKDNTSVIKSINFNELIRYIYYNAVINAKKIISRRILKQFLVEHSIKDPGEADNKDPCRKYMMRGKEEKTERAKENKDEGKLKIAEYLIREMWNYLPDLKYPIFMASDEMKTQMNKLLNYQDDCDLDSTYQEVDNEKINWNYLVTRDGETMYLKVPTYDSHGEFLPSLARPPEAKPELTESDFVRRTITRKIRMSLVIDVFDKKLIEILDDQESLVGEKFAEPDRMTKEQRIMSYIKIRNSLRKKDIVQSEMWDQFNKRYFSFDEDEPYDPGKKCSYPLTPHEFYDQIPTYVAGKVRPIEFRVDNARYLCAACGLFIKDKGVNALGHKWHLEHFRCRICCEKFTRASNFILYRGIVLCTYDADKILGATYHSALCPLTY